MKKILEILLTEKGKGVLRHLITFVGASLVTLGYVDESIIETISGFVLSVGGFILSILNKKTA